MPNRFSRSHPSTNEFFDGKHRREHWYRDNSIYFITARCRDKSTAFESSDAGAIFWDRADHWSAQYGFVPIVRTLMNNHYHFLGYLKVGKNLGEMMRRIHGSIAKLANDVLSQRLVPFWEDDYFDGCLRDGSSFAGRISMCCFKRCGRRSCEIGATIHIRA